jgi:hypothetical protein
LRWKSLAGETYGRSITPLPGRHALAFIAITVLADKIDLGLIVPTLPGGALGSLARDDGSRAI